jgi:hypothetical protein
VSVPPYAIRMAETRKAHGRRLKEGFYERFCQGRGIDIGVGRVDTFDGEDALRGGLEGDVP